MSEITPIRVILVDDHAMVRSGLKAFFIAFKDLELVGEASNGERAIKLCEQAQPDVVLMDIMMPGMDGIAATKQIREKFPAIQVIALTSFKDQELVEGAIKAGAIGYLLKDISAQELANAVRAAAAGKPTLATEAAQALIQATRGPAQKPGFDLTDREREVLALMVKGYNNNQIADQLVVQLSTVKFHVHSLLSKLGATSRTEAVSIALHHNIIK